jgi:hypothetical protein
MTDRVCRVDVFLGGTFKWVLLAAHLATLAFLFLFVWRCDCWGCP